MHNEITEGRRAKFASFVCNIGKFALAKTEMASLYGLNRYKYIQYLLEHRPSMEMSGDELEHFAPWAPDVQAASAKTGK